MFVIYIFSHLPLKSSKLGIILATIMDDLFARSYCKYNFCSKPNFIVPDVRAVHNCQNSIYHYVPLIWNVILNYIKVTETLDISKKPRKWKPINCPCRFCHYYILNLSFVIQVWFKTFTYDAV